VDLLLLQQLRRFEQMNQGACHYFQFGYLPEPASPFRAIRKLMPGCWLQYDEAGGARQDRYWKLPVSAEREPAGITRERMRDLVRETVDEAVRIRMLADVPLGAFLSGSIDSSSVVHPWLYSRRIR